MTGPGLLASGCKLSNCFQQGFDHPTPLSFAAGLLIIAVVTWVIRAIAKPGSGS